MQKGGKTSRKQERADGEEGNRSFFAESVNEVAMVRIGREINRAKTGDRCERVAQPAVILSPEAVASRPRRRLNDESNAPDENTMASFLSLVVAFAAPAADANSS